MPADDLRDVRRQAAHDRVGDEDPAEVVRGEDQWCAGGVGQAGGGEGVEQQFAQRGRGDRPVLAADAALEQQRHGRVPDPLAHVVGGHQRDRAVRCAEPADDRAEHVGEFGADQQQPFGVGLGGGDLQQRHELAGGGQPVLGDAVVGQLEQLLTADAGQAQGFDRGEGPECLVFFVGQVAPPAGDGVLRPDAAAVDLVGGLWGAKSRAWGRWPAMIAGWA
jgi:hypothetical protein